MSTLDNLDLQAMTTPEALGATLRHAYSIEDVAGAINAVINEQKPAIGQFIADEGIPMLAAIGSGEVAKNARGGKSKLAAAVGDLGGGASGLQGLAALVTKPGKASGISDLMQYLPLLQQFSGGGGNGAPASLPPSQSSNAYSGGGGKM